MFFIQKSTTWTRNAILEAKRLGRAARRNVTRNETPKQLSKEMTRTAAIALTVTGVIAWVVTTLLTLAGALYLAMSWIKLFGALDSMTSSLSKPTNSIVQLAILLVAGVATIHAPILLMGGFAKLRTLLLRRKTATA